MDERAADVRAVLAFAAALVISGAVASRAQECEVGAFGCGHAEHHEQYQQWKPKDGKGSCCKR